ALVCLNGYSGAGNAHTGKPQKVSARIGFSRHTLFSRFQSYRSIRYHYAAEGCNPKTGRGRLTITREFATVGQEEACRRNDVRSKANPPRVLRNFRRRYRSRALAACRPTARRPRSRPESSGEIFPTSAVPGQIPAQ